jgi:prepilin-type processing-associated H-X9-DG protein
MIDKCLPLLPQHQPLYQVEPDLLNMPTPQRRLAAFTIVELLVVIAVIGILIGMLTPAVQQARESSRRSQCSNNLKQIGIAYHCYETVSLSLPPAYLSGPPPYPGQPSSDPKPAVGWGIFILPYLDYKSLYDQYNFKAIFYDGYPTEIRNQRIANTSIPIFQCPSAPPRGPYTYSFNYPGYPSMSWQASAADYSPVARVHEDLTNYLGLTYTADQRKGALEPDRPTPPNIISDGSSHTILVAEIAGKNDLWQNGRNSGQKLSGQYGGQGGWADATSAASVLIGSSDDGTTAPGSNGVNSSNDLGLYSFHRSMVNVLMADGSILIIPSDIDILALINLVTRAGGEMENYP